MRNNKYTFAGGQGSFARAPYRGNPSRNDGFKKHSGAKFKEGVSKDGKQFAVVYGWNFSKQRGLISFIASPYKGTHVVSSKNGKDWANWFVKITIHRTMQVVNASGLYELGRRRLFIKDFGMVANPSAPNGGYFGKFTR